MDGCCVGRKLLACVNVRLERKEAVERGLTEWGRLCRLDSCCAMKSWFGSSFIASWPCTAWDLAVWGVEVALVG